MRFRAWKIARKRLLIVISLLGTLAWVVGTSGCARSTAQADSDQRARFTRMLDERRYSEVVRLLTPMGAPDTASPYPDLLAMAYLGKSGFEPLQIAQGVLAEQGAGASKLEGLDVFFENCSNRELNSADDLELRCLVKRIWIRLPDADMPDFAAARSLFRAAYPKPEETPPKYNTLIAVVEAGSALSRTARLAALSTRVSSGSLSPNAAIVVEAGRLALLGSVEAAWTLRRARYSVVSVSKLLLGTRQEALLTGAGDVAAWSESTGLPAIQRFAEGAKETADTVALLGLVAQSLGRTP